MQGTFVPKNFNVTHFTPLQNKITSHKSRQFSSHHCTPHHLTYLHWTPAWIPLLVTTFLILFLKVFSLHGKGVSKPTGNWFQLLLILFTKEYLPISVIEGKIGGSIEVTGRRRRKRKQLLESIWETRGYRKLKKGALDRTVWRSRFGRSCGSIVRETILRNSGNYVLVNTALSSFHKSRLLSHTHILYLTHLTRSKRDGLRAEIRFGLSAKRTSPFKSAGVSAQSTAGSRGVRISGQQLYRPCSDIRWKAAGYPLHSHLSRSHPHPCVTVCHQIPNALCTSNCRV